MYIYREINKYEFVDMFDECNRSDNFTRQARRELFEYYSELAEGCGEPFQMDVIAICCDWSEYTAEELWDEYDDGSSFDDADGIIDWLRDNTTVLVVEHFNDPSTYLVAAF